MRAGGLFLPGWVHPQPLQQRDDGLDLLEAGFVGEGLVRQDIPDAQQRPDCGVGRQGAVKVLLILHEITPVVDISPI